MMTDLLAEIQQPLPFWDLFEHLCSRKIALILDDYGCLKRSVRLGYVKTPEDLQEVCALLWMKPHNRDLFQKAFLDYQQPILPVKPESNEISATITTLNRPETKPQSPVSDLPPLPLRPMPQGNIQVLGGLQTPPADHLSLNQNWKFSLNKLPISAQQVRDSWRVLKQLPRSDTYQDIDVEKTIAQINPLGWIEEIAWHSAVDEQAELLVLVDEGDNMQTYLPALSKLFEAIKEHRIHHAQIYRFTGYPWRFLYRWQQPNKAVVAETVLERCHVDRTILLVVSDCGAAIGFHDEDRIRGSLAFLDRWQHSVRPILWLNPVPSDRWVGTPAAEIQDRLEGRMFTPEEFTESFLRRLVGWQA
jgi:uncharacterized protein